MPSTNSTSTFFGLPLPSLNFGNNIIDVSSLTTLIGSTVGESLVLGTRGPAGLAWSSTSSFGLLWIIRGCINGASPGWLREVIGIRSGVSDSCLGMELNWYSIRSGAVRKSLSQAIGIVCDNHIEVIGCMVCRGGVEVNAFSYFRTNKRNPGNLITPSRLLVKSTCSTA